MQNVKKVVILASELMLDAYSVLVQSESGLKLIGSASQLDALRSILSQEMPDVILLDLTQVSDSHNEAIAYRRIHQVRSSWPDVLCVTIVKYASQLAAAVGKGADIALVEGVSAEKLIAAIEWKADH